MTTSAMRRFVRLLRRARCGSGPGVANLSLAAIGAGLICLVLAAAPARAADLCNNTDTAAVRNNPPNPATPCSLAAAAHITSIVTYHWNGGAGAKPGTLLLVNTGTGARFGPFPAIGSPGQGGAPNANWTATVNIAVPAGSYQVIDSDVPTWSWNAGSRNFGFAIVRGDLAPAMTLNPAHYHCYEVSQTSTQPNKVTLHDQFQTANPVIVGQPVMLCAPVQKNGEPAPDMTTHLLCYSIEGAKPANKQARIINQFGTQTLSINNSQLLCVPSRKTLVSGLPTQACPSGPTSKGQPVGGLHCPCNYPVDWGSPTISTTNPTLANWWASCRPPLQCLGNTPGQNPFGDSSCQ